MKIYCTKHFASEAVCEAMAEGFGCERDTVWERPLTGPAAFYGRDRGTLAIMRQCVADGTDWFMADNGYLTPRIQGDPEAPGRFAGYYKISRNGFQCDGLGEPDYDRLNAILALTGQEFIADWRETNDEAHILICPPIPDYERVHFFSTFEWNRYTVKGGLRRRTDRNWRHRYKPGDPRAKKKRGRTLEEDFDNCHAVITHDSNIVVEAILAGIPVFVTGDSPAKVWRNVDLANIDNPNMENVSRAKWLATLANNQWTLDEIRQGMANQVLGIRSWPSRNC